MLCMACRKPVTSLTGRKVCLERRRWVWLVTSDRFDGYAIKQKQNSTPYRYQEKRWKAACGSFLWRTFVLPIPPSLAGHAKGDEEVHHLSPPPEVEVDAWTWKKKWKEEAKRLANENPRLELIRLSHPSSSRYTQPRTEAPMKRKLWMHWRTRKDIWAAKRAQVRQPQWRGWFDHGNHVSVSWCRCMPQNLIQVS